SPSETHNSPIRRATAKAHTEATRTLATTRFIGITSPKGHSQRSHDWERDFFPVVMRFFSRRSQVRSQRSHQRSQLVPTIGNVIFPVVMRFFGRRSQRSQLSRG